MSTHRPVIAITQARMNSTRLPAKVLRPILGKPMLWWHLTRLRRAKRLDGVIVATTEGAEADPIVAIADGLGIPVHRGSEQDVLARFAGAAARMGAETIVRVTSDCPLIDPGLVDEVVDEYLAHHPATQYVSLDVARFPRGLDTEVFSRGALDQAWDEAADPFEHEHVTPFLWRRPERFGLRQLGTEEEIAPCRLCVDEEADLALVTRLIEMLARDRPHFTWRDCVDLVGREPGLAALNAHIRQRPAV